MVVIEDSRVSHPFRRNRPLPQWCIVLIAMLSLGPSALCNEPAPAHRLQVRDAASSAPVQNAIVVFARTGQRGPYAFAMSDERGDVTTRPGTFDTLLVLHPSFLPREIAASAQNTVLSLTPGEHAGAPAGLPANTSIRIYDSAWIGRFDVETLPPLSATHGCTCAGTGIVFDIAIPGRERVLATGAYPPPPDAAATGSVVVRVQSRQHDTMRGPVFLAAEPAGKPPASVLPRSAFLDADGLARFDGIRADTRYVAVAAAAGAEPAARRLRTTAAETRVDIDTTPSAYRVSARLRCTESLDGVRLASTLRLHGIDWLPIPRTTDIEQSELRVGDLAAGALHITLAADGRRELAKDVTLVEQRPDVRLGDLCPPPPYTIRGVVTSEDGRPVKGATARYGDVKAETDANGRFVLTAARPDAGALKIEREPFLPWRRWFEPSDVPSLLKVTLARGVRYRGKVVDAADGAPVPRFRMQCDGFDELPVRLCDQPVTSADGTFTTPPVSRAFRLFVVTAPGYEISRTDVPRANDDASFRDLGTLEVTPLSRIRGRVVDEDGQPVHGAIVRARSSALPEWDSGTADFNAFQTATRDDGTFQLPVAGGTYRLIARASGFAPSQQTEVAVHGEANAGDLELHAGCVVSVEVRPLRAAGTLPAVELHRGSADDQSDILSAQVDEHGRATFAHVGAGDYTVTVTARRRLAERPLHVEAESCPAEALILDTGNITVRGLATDRGQPLFGATLSLFPTASLSAAGMTVVRKRPDENGQLVTEERFGKAAAANSSRTDDTGFFRFDDVAPGQYQLTLEQNGDARSRTITIPDVDEFDASTDFGGNGLLGTVVDAANGAAIAASSITLQNDRGLAVETTTSDDFGRFELANASADGVRVLAEHDGYESGAAAVAASNGPLTLSLAKAKLALRGEVVRDGAPVASALVVWQLTGRAAPAGGSLVADARGAFEISDLSDGVLTLAAGTPGLGITFDQVRLSDDAPARSIPVSGSAALRVRLPGGARAQDVHLRYSGADVTQMLWRFPMGTPAAAGPSEWLWNSLGAGTYDVVVGNAVRRVTLTEGARTDVSFDR